MIITLIGSLRWEPEWHDAARCLTLAGHVVISVAVFPSTMPSREWYSPAEKTTLDLVHLEKVRMADTVVLVHPEYIGDSTAREILFADMHHKRVVPGAVGVPFMGRATVRSWEDVLGEVNGLSDYNAGLVHRARSRLMGD